VTRGGGFSILDSRLTILDSQFSTLFRADEPPPPPPGAGAKASAAMLAESAKTIAETATDFKSNFPKNFAARFAQVEKRDKKERLRARYIEQQIIKMDKRIKEMHKKVMGVADNATQRMGDLSESDSPLSEDEESDVDGVGTAAVLHTGVSDELAKAMEDELAAPMVTNDSQEGATSL